MQQSEIQLNKRFFGIAFKLITFNIVIGASDPPDMAETGEFA